ncbi:MAG TPA: zinc-ribbon domain-containing protein [Pyrinomonadaceae bacterium]
MIVTCPNCTTRLQLDAAKIPARPFSVRCPKCQQIINAQPPTPTPTSHRDALAAVGDVPSSTRPQEAAAAPVAAPPLAEAVAAPPPPPDPQDELLRLLASLLRREAAGEGAAAGARPEGRRAWGSRRRALVCAGSAFGGDAVNALRRDGYDVAIAGDANEAVERMREDQFAVLVLDPEFDVRTQGALRVGRELASMRTSERRRLVVVMLSNTARTGDAHAAFLAGANLVVSMKEVAELPRALERNMRDLNELYRDFNKALGLAEL